MLHSRMAIMGLCSIGIFSGTALAQTTGGVEQVIVTAQRRSENIQNVPITVSAFTAKQITDMGLKASSDLGQVVPNVDIALPAGAGNQPIITIRGIGLNDYDTNNAGPNGIYVDEVYLSSPASQTFSMFDLSDVQVLKGPQGTLFGRNSSGGAILFTTVKPSDELTADIHGEYSSFNTSYETGGIGGQLAPNLDGRFAFEKYNSSGYMFNYFNHSWDNGGNNWAARGELQYQPNEQWKFLLNFHGGDVANRPIEYRHLGALVPGTGFAFDVCSVALVNAGACADLFNFGTPKPYYSGSYNRTEHLQVANYGTYLRTEFTPGNSIVVTNITAFEHNNKLHPEDSDAEPLNLLQINFGVRNDEFTEELRAAQQTETYDWQAGLYYLWEDLHQNQPLDVFYDGDLVYGPGSFNGVAFIANDYSDQVSNSFAIYAQGDYKITDNLKLTLGGRGTLDTKRFAYNGSFEVQTGGRGVYGAPIPVASLTRSLTNPDFDWKAVLDYYFDDDVHAYASAATGYKAGGFNGSFLSMNPLQTQQQLQPISPEHVTSFELGIKSSFFDNKLIADASAFYNFYRDMQVFALVIESKLPNNVLTNAKDTHTEGFDLSLTANPVDRLILKVDAGYLQTRIDKWVPGSLIGDLTGNQLALSPHFSMEDSIDYTIPVYDGDLEFQFNASYKTHQYFTITAGPLGPSQDPYTVQNAYWLENIRLGYSFDDGKWEVAGWVRNLSDQRYYLDEFDLIVPFGFVQGIVGTPRTLGVEVNYRF